MDPRLPPELERLILELVALSHPVSIPNLLLVASRVRAWVQPLVHRTVVVTRDRRVSPVDGLRSYRPEVFFQIAELQRPSLDSVRNLMLVEIDDELASILSACPHVQNLYFIWPGDDSPSDASYAALSALPLLHFYCHSRYVIHAKPFSQPFLTNISHLELFDAPQEEDWPKLAQLPQLTHLGTGAHAIRFCAFALEKCKTLRVLVITSSAPNPERDYSTVAKDWRFVMMQLSYFIDDWQRGALHGHDYWARAEDFMAKRRAGHPAPDPDHPFHLVC
ncbi:hypothetical protein FB45DRAFT_890364 [Roridomyces roridus]|uniref:Uncharacterized protein n=1 Tax=Roridomyces roridus TaxID=1738132 RepID=A0AAD7CNJ5_9AGAR|nr:hypothetical protein FB45DRAFT_890364 [Roridomyces roridus]